MLDFKYLCLITSFFWLLRNRLIFRSEILGCFNIYISEYNFILVWVSEWNCFYFSFKGSISNNLFLKKKKKSICVVSTWVSSLCSSCVQLTLEQYGFGLFMSTYVDFFSPINICTVQLRDLWILILTIHRVGTPNSLHFSTVSLNLLLSEST